MKKLSAIALICLLVCQFAIAIPSKTFYSDGIIQEGDEWWGVNIYDTPPNHTTVTMTGGNIVDAGIAVFNAATLNMSGGGVGGGLYALDQSTISMSGGYVNGVGVSENATLNISNNASVHWVNVSGSNILNVYGGIIDGSVLVYGSSVVNVHGGTIGYLSGSDSSIFNLMGGSITSYIGAGYSATINIYGYDLIKTDTGGTYGDGQVTGFWQDNSPFVINLRYEGTYSAINLIPEPATLLLFGLGTFLFRKSR